MAVIRMSRQIAVVIILPCRKSNDIKAVARVELAKNQFMRLVGIPIRTALLSVGQVNHSPHTLIIAFRKSKANLDHK